MATKSILKQITIKDKKSCEALVTALEYSANKKSQQVDAPIPTLVKLDDIKKLKLAFGK